jgi:hypothetical protein
MHTTAESWDKIPPIPQPSGRLPAGKNRVQPSESWICCPIVLCQSTDVFCQGQRDPSASVAWWICRTCGERFKDVPAGATHRPATLR